MKADYIIEHPTRGSLMEGPWESKDGKWHWAWSGSRLDARRFTLPRAKGVLGLLPAKVRERAYVLELPTMREIRLVL